PDRRPGPWTHPGGARRPGQCRAGCHGRPGLRTHARGVGRTWRIGWQRSADDGSDGTGRMRLVVTLMVRDEVDIIAAMIEHHLAQGADLIIATDNGSVDGTTDVLQRYADQGVLELHHDP